MLQPNQDWCWYTLGEYLAIELGNTMYFQTAYPLSSLTVKASEVGQFTLEQHAVYSTICTELEPFDCWSAAEKTQLAINALALSLFGKPLAAKSWYFDVAPATQAFNQYKLAYLKLGKQFSTVIVLQQEINSVYCMLIDNEFEADEGKNLEQFTPLKVMENRLFQFRQ